MENKNSSILNKILYPYSITRSAAFLLQNLTLPLVQFTATGKSRLLEPGFKENLKLILPQLNELLKKDAQNIENGLYPAEVLAPMNPLSMLSQFGSILGDTYGLAKRRDEKKTKEFAEEAQQWISDLPDYYQRNFHFQTDGYLSQKSARLYEHQVEILFSGAANPMRRLLIPAVHMHLSMQEGAKDIRDGSGLHFLEVGAGTGSLTRFMKMAFPQLKITTLDLSEPYLQQAKKNLQDFSKVNFIQGDAANLPFQEGSFDGVYSCFLFHELPYEVRKQVIAEGLRVLKPGGFYGLVDSLQAGDNSSLDWALQKFPVDFHEPFYKNYSDNPMELLLQEMGLTNIQSDQGFFSKAVHGSKALG